MLMSSDGTAYTVLNRADGTHAVEVFPHDSLPQIHEGFKTAAEAEQWAYEHATAEGATLPAYAGPAHITPGV